MSSWLTGGGYGNPYWLGTNPPPGPKFQYGTATGTGAQGNTLITLSTAYTSINYFVLVTHQGTTAGTNTAANIVSPSTFDIYWKNAGPGAQGFTFLTIGSSY